MSYPFDEENSDAEIDIELDLQILRQALMVELQAINEYQEHIDTLEDEDAINVLRHILDDKKGHVAQLVKLIQKLDPVQAEKLAREIL